jgi:hypothetical protein
MYKYERANYNSIKGILDKKPIGIHFSCHGHARGKSKDITNYINTFAKKAQPTGDALLLEDEEGTGQFFFESDI